MKIAFVSQYFWPESVPYSDPAFFLGKKHEVIVLTAFPNHPTGKIYEGYKLSLFQKEEKERVKIYRFLTYPYKGYNKLKRLLNYTVFPFIASIFSPFLLSKFDVIFAIQGSPVTSVIPGIILKAIYKKHLVIWIQDLWPETLDALGIFNKSNFVYKVLESLSKYIYKSADLLLVESPGFEKTLLRKGIKKEKILYLPNWSMVEQSKNVDNGIYDEDLDLLNGYFNVIYAGNISYFQGCDLLVNVAKELKNYKNIQIVLIGTGVAKKEISKLKEDYKLANLLLIDKKSPNIMHKFFEKAGCLFIQLKKHDAFSLTIPSKLQSYMSSGKPIIAAIEGTSAEIVKEANAGIVCEPENISSISKAIIKMFEMSAEERLKMGLNGLKYANENFDKIKIINRLEKYLLEEVSEKAIV